MVLWLIALEWTSIAKGALFTTCYPIILVVWYKIRKIPVSRYFPLLISHPRLYSIIHNPNYFV